MASRFLKLKKTIEVHKGRLSDEEFVRLITKQRDSQLKFDTADKWGRGRGGGPEIGARNSHNNYRSSVNLFFVPLPGPLRPPSLSAGGRAFQQRKTSRHKADRFSRLIHLVEVNKHCVPYLSSAQLMRERNPLALCRATFFLLFFFVSIQHPRRPAITAYRDAFGAFLNAVLLM